MEIERDLYRSQSIHEELSKCRIFELKHPKRGGQHNDYAEYELSARLKCGNSGALLSRLDRIGIKYALYKFKPRFECPPPFKVDGEDTWIGYRSYVEDFGFKFHLTIWTSECEIGFNLGLENKHGVTLSEVNHALRFERFLIERNVLDCGLN